MATPQAETSEDKTSRKAPLQHSSRESRMLSRTQALMVVVSLIPLGVLFYISATFVFEPLMEQGQGAHVYSISAVLVFTALTVLLGYVLVRRDTVRAITAIGEGERRLDQLHVATGAIAAHTDPAEAAASFPDPELGLVRNQDPSATESLARLQSDFCFPPMVNGPDTKVKPGWKGRRERKRGAQKNLEKAKTGRGAAS